MSWSLYYMSCGSALASKLPLIYANQVIWAPSWLALAPPGRVEEICRKSPAAVVCRLPSHSNKWKQFQPTCLHLFFSHLPHINALFPQLVVPVYKIFLHKYLHHSVRNMYAKFQPNFVGCGHAMTWMSRPHLSQLSNRLLMRYPWIPTTHGPVTTCDSIPCVLPCDGSVVTHTHALWSQSEFSNIEV